MSERRNHFDRASSTPVTQSSPASPRQPGIDHVLVFLDNTTDRVDSLGAQHRYDVEAMRRDMHLQHQDRGGAPSHASDATPPPVTGPEVAHSGRTDTDCPSTDRYPIQAPLSPADPTSHDYFDQVILPRRTSLHQRRLNRSRICSLPTLPSPLGPRRVRGNYGVGSMDNPMSPAAPFWASSTHHHRIYSEPENSHVAGLRQRFGHSRQHTDPFVDDGENETETVDANPVRLGATRWFPFTSMISGSLSARHASFQLCSPRTPFGPECAVGPVSQSAAWPSSASSAAGNRFPRALMPGYLSTGSPAAQINPLVQPDFTIRSPLQPPYSVQDQDTLEHHGWLEKRKQARQAWIRDEAAQIARLAKLRHALELRFHTTHSPDDYDDWQRIETEFAETTNLDSVQKERRGLFLKEKGMVPLMTHTVEDMSAANRSAEADGHGEEKLLGFKMGLMERVCAEVMPERKDVDGTAITAEMVDTLGLEERKALRAHLVGRLGRL